MPMATHWPEPLVAEPVARDRGPVLILIEVEKEHRSAFLRALDHLSHERCRDGAYAGAIVSRGFAA
jgi:hypothetical protein